MKLSLTAIILILGVSNAWANPVGVHLNGQISDSVTGASLTATNVDFAVKVLSPGGCLLYSEYHLGKNLSLTSGNFDIDIGTGSTAFNVYDAVTPQISSSIVKVFDKASPPMAGLSNVDAGGCPGGNYTPAAGDVREVRIEFDAHDGLGTQIIQPYHKVTNIPFALLAEKAGDSESLQGKVATDFVLNTDLATVVPANETDPSVQTFAKTALPGCNAGEVLKAVGGVLSCVSSGGAVAVATTTSTGIVQIGSGLSVDGAGLLTTDTAAIKAGLALGITDVSGLQTALDDRVLYSQMPSCTAGEVWTFVSPVGGFVCTPTSITASQVSDFSAAADARIAADTTKLPVAGGTMTGAINMNDQNFTNTGYITMNPSKSLHLSNNAADPVGLVLADKGKVWYNSTTNQMKYWDGAAVQVLGVSGSGLTSFNGESGGTQTLAVPGTAGTAPAWSSAGNAHTLNIPMAATAGTTAGLLSKTDYDSFAGKQAAGNYVTDLTGDVTAAGPGSVAATIAAGAVNSSKILDGTILGSDLNFTGVNNSTSGIAVVDSAGKFFNFACATAGDVPTWTASGFACQAPVPLQPALTSGKIWIGDGSNAAVAQDMSGDATISNAGVLTLATSGVTAGTYSKVTVDAKGRVTVGADIASGDVTTALGYTPLNKTGDVMTGTLGLQQVASDPSTAGWNGTQKGYTWFNTTSNQVKYWDGSAIQALGVSGAGLTSFNGESGSTQTLATPGSAGTAPAWSSSGNAHTLNIPMAATAGTTAGLLSKTDYDSFAGKQPAGSYVTALTGDVTAAGPGSAAATIANDAIITAKILDGTILAADMNFTGVNTATSGIAVVDATGKFNNFACGTAGHVATWTVTGWACQAPASSGTVTSVATGTGLSGGTITGSGTISLADTAVTAGAYGSATQVGTFTVDAQGRLTAAGNTTVTPAWSSITATPTTLAGYGITDAQSSTLADGKMLVGNASNAATAVTMSGDATLSNAGALTLASSGATAGTYSKVTVDAKGRVTVGANIASGDVTTALGYTPLNKAGDVMTGSIGLGNYTNATEGTLIGAYGGGDKGKTWFNTDTNQVKYWNGSAAVALGVSGAGLTSFNGESGSTQTLATPGTAGTAPAWSSAGNAHTLNIPMAATAGTTAGLLSKTDYDSFAGKQPAGSYVTALTGDVTAAGPGSAAATIANDAIITAKILDGTILAADMNFTGVNTATSGIAVVDATGKFNNFACGTAGHVATWTVTGWACQAPASSGTVTSVATGTGLSGGTITGSGTISLADTAVTAGAYGSATQVGTFTVDAQGRLTAAGNTTVTPAWSSITATPTTLAGYGIIDAQSSTLADGKILVGNGSNVATAQTMSGDATLSNAGALTLASSGATAGTYKSVTVDAKGRVTGGTNPTTLAGYGITDAQSSLGYTPLNKAGDVMTGSIGLGNYTNATEGTLIGAYGGGDKGKTWFNTDTNQVKYWNGSAAVALGVSGAGLTSFNGETGSTQTLATPGTAGTAPAWSSSGNAHTLNIPMAATAGTTAGLLSKTDYDSFAGKQPAGSYVTALTGDITAAGPGSAAATIANDAITTIKINNLAVTDAKINDVAVNKITSGVGKYFTYAPNNAACSNGQILSKTANGWECGTANAGTVTGITAGTGLTGGTISTSGTIGLDTELAAVNALSTTGFVQRTGAGAYSTAAANTAASNNTLVQRDGSGVSNFYGVGVSGATSGSVTLQSPGTVTSYALTLPNAQGASGQVLSNNGTGVLSWSDLGAAPANASYINFVRVATTGNITLSGTQTIDGVAVIAGDRVLVKNQTTTSQNGVYVVAAGAWARAADMDSWSEVVGYSAVVTEGNANSGYRASPSALVGGTLGTTGLYFNLLGSNEYFTSSVMGTRALNSNVNGIDNIAIGYQTLMANTGGDYNVAVGTEALTHNTTGNDNTAVGELSVYSNTTGIRNVGLGSKTLYNNTTGSNNIAIGYDSGSSITTGSNNVVIGSNTGASIATSSNNILISDGAGNERARFDSAGKLGLGTTSPSFALDIQGTAAATGFGASAQNFSATGWTRQAVFNDSSNNLEMRVYGSTAAGTSYGISNNNLGTLQASGFSAFVIGVDTAPLIFANNNSTERMRLTTAGNFGIGTTNPGAPLDVKGAIRMSGSTSGYTGFQPAVDAGSTVWTLPAADGSAGQVLKTNGAGVLSWVTDAGSSLEDSTYVNKGVVQFLTNADTSGINIAAGVANVNTGTTANKILKLDGTAKIPAVDGSLVTNLNPASLSSAVGVAKGGTGSTSFTTNGLVMSGATGTSALTAINCAVAGGHLEWTGSTFSCSKDFLSSGAPGSKVNYVLLTGANTGSSVTVSAGGSDSNISLVLSAKGTGMVDVGSAYIERVPAAASNTHTISADRNIHRVALSADSTITLPATPVAAGNSFSLTVKVKQDGTGNRAITWATGSGSLKWDSGTTPDPATGADEETIYQFLYLADDATWYGMQVWKEQ